MTRFLERLLNLRPGELGHGVLFFLYLFFVIASFVVGKVARDALFLGKFEAIQLPYVDIAVALLVGLVAAVYVRIGRRVNHRDLLVGSLTVFALNCLIFWWLAHAYRPIWLYPAFYVWVGIFGVIAPMQVWTLANYLLTTREAKRLFGILGGGAIAGWIFAGYFAKIVARRHGAEDLLPGVAVFLMICAVLVLMIWRQKPTSSPARADGEQAAEPRESPGLRESLHLLWSDSSLRTLASVIWISSFATTLAGWQFKAMAKQVLTHQDALAAFFGDFNFYSGLLGLAVQLFVTARLLRRYGLGITLFVVPVAMFGASIGILVWGTLAAAVMLRGADQVFRYSIDKSSVELLYLPLAPGLKLHAKSFIDTVVWRLGDGFAGVVVLVFAGYLHVSARNISWFNLLILGGWVLAAALARREYVARLSECIQQHRLDAERSAAPVIDRFTIDVLVAKLNVADPEEILYALDLFEIGSKPVGHPALRPLLNHAWPQVRRKALAILNAAHDRSVAPEAERLLSDPHIEVRTEALLYLVRHTHLDPLARIKELGDYSDFSIRSGMVLFLARPGETQNMQTAGLILEGMVHDESPEGKAARMEAARLLALLPGPFDQQLGKLISDKDVDVAREAVRTAGLLGKRQHVPLLLGRLAEPELEPAAVEALAGYGDRAIGTFRDYLRDSEVPLAIRLVIPGILARIGTGTAERVLIENLLDNDSGIRFRIIAALNKIHLQHPDLVPDRGMIETALASEIFNHCTSYHILELARGDTDFRERMARELEESMQQDIERIFRLLSLLHPRQDFHSAHVGLRSGNPVIHANALEFLDNVLNPQLRDMLVPLLDPDVTFAERVSLAGRLVRLKAENLEQMVAALIASDNLWLKSCGVYAVGALGLKSLAPALGEYLDHADPRLRETARQAKLRLAGQSASPDASNLHA